MDFQWFNLLEDAGRETEAQRSKGSLWAPSLACGAQLRRISETDPASSI